MKILFVADGRSPITHNWMSYFIHSDHAVHLASTYPCQPIAGLATLHFVPVAMSELYGRKQMRSSLVGRVLRSIVPVGMRTRIRHQLAASSFPRSVRGLCKVIDVVQPDLIHAMRIPFEGMIASMARNQIKFSASLDKKPKLLISVWGNDFTLHATIAPKLAAYTRLALSNCDALHTDCLRDMRLANGMGFAAEMPHIVLPGGGGVDLGIFYPRETRKSYVPEMIIINPRGFRAYVRNDTIFQAIPHVIKEHREVKFICTDMAGDAQAQRWVTELGIGPRIELLPFQPKNDMAELFRRSQVSLSITTHDGTPNTLLEAMACGCFPIAGDIESIREWITHGENGFLVDPGNPEALGRAIVQAISNPGLRQRAAELNLEIVRERAEYQKCMRSAEEFYQQVLASN